MLASMLRASDSPSGSTQTPSVLSGSTHAPGSGADGAAVAAAKSSAAASSSSPADEEGVAMPDLSPSSWRQHIGVLPKGMVIIEEEAPDGADEEELQEK